MDESSVARGKPSSSDMVLTLNRIRGVYASCVVLDSERNVNEIHIVASADRKPKQIVRDVETILFVKHGTKVDYRKISMVQISDEELLQIPVARPEIQRVTEDIVGNQKRIQVQVKGGGRVVTGEAFERVDSPSPFNTSARATIDALSKLLEHSLDFQLNDAQIFRIGSHEILVVIVTCLTQDREETLVGTSFVGTRMIEAGVRATFDALNRRIHNLALQAPRESQDDV